MVLPDERPTRRERVRQDTPTTGKSVQDAHTSTSRTDFFKHELTTDHYLFGDSPNVTDSMMLRAASTLTLSCPLIGVCPAVLKGSV
jgi:hypothetical protein